MSGRLPAGGVIDRTRPVRFSFDGRTYGGFAGDTLASALLANGVRLFGRSFKYHRPRGVLAAGAEEPNALVETGVGAARTPNTQATVLEIFEGLVAVSQNRFPSLRFDLMSVNAVLAPLFAAGFYYKTFMWPASFWERVYEPLIRRAAGLGRGAGAADPGVYEKVNLFYDVLVVGGGRSGLTAARAAAREGARVLLCEQDFALRGRCLGDGAEAPEDLADVTVLTRTTVFGAYDGGVFAAVERLAEEAGVRQRLYRIVAKQCVVAAGAIERPLLFGNNDLPGVMLAGAVRSYLNRYAAVPGRRAVVYANHDEAAATLPTLRKAGIEVVAYVDPREDIPAATRAAAARAGAPVLAGAVLRRAFGRLGLAGVEVESGGARRRLRCDVLAMSGGWTPTLHLTTHLGGKPVWDAARGGFVPGRLPAGMSVVGRAAGGPPAGGAPRAVPLARIAGKAFVDFQNDVAVGDVVLARREGFAAVEQVKRYTTLGMATDQGKTSGVNGLLTLAEMSGRDVAALRVTTYRPPYTPVAIGALAGAHRGRDFRPTRRTPTHLWAAGLDAKFVETGPWLRAQYFPRGGEDWLAATCREVLAVREAVGVCDVSTLGKIDIQGPDAVALLDFVYANGWRNLVVGRARYGIMLREDGFVLDDGTTARLGDTHYLMTTTTANAARVMQHLEFCRQWLRPDLDVQIVSVTDQWAQLAVAGPRARELLRRVVAEDVSDAALPYLGVMAVTVAGVAGRLFRLSFSGELAYELAVPAHFGAALAALLLRAGAALGATAYGTEALGVLRIEKGHPAGNELDGRVTAHDLLMDKLLSTRKDFVGRALAGRPALTDRRRPRLVGLRPVAGARIRAGAHLLAAGATAAAANDAGHVSSVAFSPTFGAWIGLGFLTDGPARHGEVVRVHDPLRGGDALATVVPPVFYDAGGSRPRA